MNRLRPSLLTAVHVSACAGVSRTSRPVAPTTELTGLLRAANPRGEVASAWRAKEAVRFLYDIPNPDYAGRYLD